MTIFNFFFLENININVLLAMENPFSRRNFSNPYNISGELVNKVDGLKIDRSDQHFLDFYTDRIIIRKYP